MVPFVAWCKIEVLSNNTSVMEKHGDREGLILGEREWKEGTTKVLPAKQYGTTFTHSHFSTTLLATFWDDTSCLDLLPTPLALALLVPTDCLIKSNQQQPEQQQAILLNSKYYHLHRKQHEDHHHFLRSCLRYIHCVCQRLLYLMLPRRFAGRLWWVQKHIYASKI